jgi:hypothetical protein
MALSPALLVDRLQPLFTVPVPVGTTFTGGDVVVIGTATSDTTKSICGVAMQDYNALGSTGFTNSICIMGRARFPKAAGTSIGTAGVKVWWGTTGQGVLTTNSTGIIVAHLGTALATASTSVTTVDVFFYPNQG